MNVFVGIDVSKDKLDLCWIRDLETHKKKSKVFKNQKGHFQDIQKWLTKNIIADPSEILITLEATGVYHEPVIHYLHDLGYRVYLANPAQAKDFANSLGRQHKTDKLDAGHLALFGSMRLKEIELWAPEPLEVRELKAQVRRLDALEKDLRREENRLEAGEFSGASERVIESLHNMINVLKSEIKKLENDIDNHIDNHPKLKKDRKLLESIVGVGPVVSREMLSVISSRTFTSAKQLAAYLGLIPQIQESGNWKGQTRLSKKGNSRVRSKLYLAAVTASQYNPDVKDQRRRMLEKGKAKMQVIGAAMRKLVHICFGVIKNQQEYQPQVTI